MLFKRIEIANISIPLYRHTLSLKQTEHIEKDVINESSAKKLGLVKFFRTKFNEKKQSSMGVKLTRDSIEQLSDLKETNFLKFHINGDNVLEFLLNKLLNRQTYPFSICVESIQITNNHWLTDRGIELIGKFMCYL